MECLEVSSRATEKELQHALLLGYRDAGEHCLAPVFLNVFIISFILCYVLSCFENICYM